jgi:hypothetical protein
MLRHPNDRQSTADADVDGVDVTAAGGMAAAADGSCDEYLRTRAPARCLRLASRRMFWPHRRGRLGAQRPRAYKRSCQAGETGGGRPSGRRER